MTATRLCIFVKYPIPGNVKTRLALSTSDDFASEIYKAFVQDLLHRLSKEDFPITIAYDPTHSAQEYKQWCGPGVEYISQGDGDLGARLKTVFEDLGQKENEKIIVIGSDCPDIPMETIHRGFHALSSEDVVIGPTRDGGYYLIGLQQFSYNPDLFSFINWSTSQVFLETMDVIQSNNMFTEVLDEWSDVDTIDDLKALLTRLKTSHVVLPNTVAVLREFDIK